MKKTILSWLLIGCSYMVFAQNTQTTGTDSTSTSTNSSTTTNPNSTMSGTTNSTPNSTINNSTNPSGNNNTMNATNGATNNNVNNPAWNNGNMSSNNQYNAYGTSVTIPYRAQVNLAKDYPTASNIMWTQAGDWYHGTYLSNGRYSHIYYDDRGNTWTVSMPVTQTYVPDDIVAKVTQMFGPTVYDISTIRVSAPQENAAMQDNTAVQANATTTTTTTGSTTDQTATQTTGNENTSGTVQSTNGTMQNSTTMTMTDYANLQNPPKYNVYHVRTLENGTVKSQWIKDDGSTIADPFRSDINTEVSTSTNAAMDTNTSGTQANTATDNTSVSGNASAGETKVKIKTTTPDGKETKTKIKDGEVKTKQY